MKEESVYIYEDNALKIGFKPVVGQQQKHYLENKR